MMKNILITLLVPVAGFILVWLAISMKLFPVLPGAFSSPATATPTPAATVPSGSSVPVVQHPDITITAPLSGTRISSPLTVTGQAKGSWYFEGSFPVVLTDWDGLIIAQGNAVAQGDWMTEAFVPFTTTLTFTKPAYGERGSLILQKANPSGLPINDDALEQLIFFQ